MNKAIILLCAAVTLAQLSFAQIPMEVMSGDKQTQYFGYIQKDLDSIGQWSVFSQSLFAVNYKDSSLNSIAIDGQVTYMLNRWLGLAAGGTFNGAKFHLVIGLSLAYMNKKGNLIITSFPTIQLGNQRSFNIFALVNYLPQFSQKWGLFSQFIMGTNLKIWKKDDAQKNKFTNFFTLHGYSSQNIRVGLNYRKKFQFGLGADLAQFGTEHILFENYGIFIRYQIE